MKGRTCQNCGREIDPVAYCMFCRQAGKPCGLHDRLRLHGNVRYCSERCRRLARKKLPN